MAFTKITNAGFGLTTGTLVGVAASFSSTVSVGGTLTYEDVTNVDSVGLITARNGIEVTDKGVQVGTGATVDSAADNTLTFLTNGSERIRVTSGGLVGIGTDIPESNSRLHTFTTQTTARTITETSSASGYAGYRLTNGTGYWEMQVDGSNQGLRFLDDGTEKLRIDSSGRLLLGTTTEGHANADNLTISSSTACGITLRSENSNDGVIYFSDGTSGAAEYDGQIEYLHSSQTMRFATAGAERLRIDSSGRLYLGTTTAGFANGDDLNIATTGHTGITIRSGTTSTGNIFFADGTSSTAQYRGIIRYDHDGDAMPFFTAASEAMRIDSSGRLLIGTSSSVGPDNFLQLVGDVNDEAAITCWRSSDDAGSGGFNFIKTRGSVSSPGVTSNGDSLGIIRWHAHDGSTWDGRAAQIEAKVDGGVAAGDTPGSLIFSTAADGASSPTERLRIDSSGRVLIGTTTEGDVDTDNLTIADSGNCGITIRSGTNNAGAIYFSDATSGGGEYDGYIAYNQPNRFMQFGTGQAERMRLDISGRLLIGTSSAVQTSTNALLQLNHADGSALILARDDSTTATNEDIGLIRFYGNDGGSYQECARISAEADGNHANNDKPTALRFYTTANNESSPTERVRIDNSGRVGIGLASPSNELHVHDPGTGSVDARIQLTNGDTGTAGSDGLHIIQNGSTNSYKANFINRENGDMGFFTNNTERMTIRSSGRVNITSSYTTGAPQLYVENGTSASGQQGLQVKLSSSSDNTSSYIIIGSSNGNKFYVLGNGNVQNTNNSYGSISDIKLKENIVDASSQWDDIKGIRVRNYNFIAGQTHTQIGVVAQEVETVSPGLVSESPDIDDEGNDLGTVTKSVNYSVLYMKAVKALQEAQTRIETLETQNTAQQTQINDLITRVTALEG